MPRWRQRLSVFVDFPDLSAASSMSSQSILLQIFGIGSFDAMALCWAVIFHKWSFYSRQAKLLVGFAWAVTFALSTLASVLYMSMNNVIDFHMTLPVSILQFGDWTVIGATVFNLICLTFFFKLEDESARPHRDQFDMYETLNGVGDDQMYTCEMQGQGAYKHY